MARLGDMKVTFDISAMNKLTQLYCMACECRHNTINRSHGTSICACGYKHLQINEGGTCKAYEAKDTTNV